ALSHQECRASAVARRLAPGLWHRERRGGHPCVGGRCVQAAPGGAAALRRPRAHASAERPLPQTSHGPRRLRRRRRYRRLGRTAPSLETGNLGACMRFRVQAPFCLQALVGRHWLVPRARPGAHPRAPCRVRGRRHGSYPRPETPARKGWARQMGTDVVLVEGVRTAIGRFGGALSPLSAGDLGAAVIREVLRRTNLEPSQVDEVIMGCVGQVAEDAYIARTSAIKAGLPKEVPAYAVNRLCSSGLQSIVSAGQAIRLGEAEVVVAGGVESMSNFPYFLRQARFGYRMGHGTLEDGLIVTLSDPFRRYHMGITAENVAERWGIDRATQGHVAWRSRRRVGAATAAGVFRDQIVPVTVPDRKGERVGDTDEHPRPDTTREQLAALKPAFKEGGTATAGK